METFQRSWPWFAGLLGAILVVNAAGPLFEVKPACKQAFDDPAAVACLNYTQAKRQADWSRFSAIVALVGGIAVGASLYFSAKSAKGAVEAVQIARRAFEMEFRPTVDFEVNVGVSVLSILMPQSISLEAKTSNLSRAAVEGAVLYLQRIDEVAALDFEVLRDGIRRAYRKRLEDSDAGRIIGPHQTMNLLNRISAPTYDEGDRPLIRYVATVVYRDQNEGRFHLIGRIIHLGAMTKPGEEKIDWICYNTVMKETMSMPPKA